MTQQAILSVQQGSVSVDGIWPGRYGAIALITFTHSVEDIVRATCEIGDALQEMADVGGQDSTRRLMTLIDKYGIDCSANPNNYPMLFEDVHIDGREYYDVLEDEALRWLAENGRFAPGPFTVDAQFLPPHLKRRMRRIRGSYFPDSASI